MTAGRDRRPVVAILGGGFSGAATAFHLARALPAREVEIVVVEPRPTLGRGLAYGTDDLAHRTNIPAAKMTLIGDDPEHFQSWLAAERIGLSPGTVGPGGEIFPERRIFGQYVAAQLAPLLAAGAVRHRRAAAAEARRDGAGYRIELLDGTAFEADFVVLAMSHPGPAVPRALRGVANSDRLVANPFAGADHLARLGLDDRLLVIGTGLTSADVIASLDRRGFRGRITALSRHGLRSRGHATIPRTSGADFARPPERTALGLLHRVRSAIADDTARNGSWHATFDRLREQGDMIWRGLDPEERGRVVRHLRRFWDAHRYRVAPRIESVLDAMARDGRLVYTAGRLIDARVEPDGLQVRYRPRGAADSTIERFDAAVVTTGPDHGEVVETNPVLRALARAGLIRPDPLGLGIEVAGRCRTVARDGAVSETLLVAGPLARGGVGELMGVPEVARHAERLAGLIAQAVLSATTGAVAPIRRPGESRPRLWTG